MLVLCGGSDPLGGTGSNDVWALLLGGSPAWSLVTPSGTPPSGRVACSVALDTGGRRAVIVGGVSGGAYQNDAWSLSLDGGSAWSPLSASGTPPAPRRYAATGYDALRGRVVLFGGEDAGGLTLDDTWELLAGVSPSWTALAPGGVDPGARRAAVAALDGANDRLIVFGGSREVGGYGELRLRDVAMLSWNNITGVGAGPIRHGSLALGTIAPQPARRGHAVRVELTLADQTPVLVQILDVRGRVIQSRWATDAERAGGTVRVDVSGSTAPGVYLLRVSQGPGTRSASRAFAVID
jgi:hypothetical protein